MKCALGILAGAGSISRNIISLLGTGSVPLDRLEAKSMHIPARREESS